MGRRLLIAASALAAGCVVPPWARDTGGSFRDSGYWMEDCDETWCVDADNDHYGDCSAGVLGITDPTPEQCEGYAPTWDGEDCDDARAGVHPYADERCNGIDDDCDGRIDDDPPSGSENYYYVDADGDGWGNSEDGYSGCATRPPGTAERNGDCDDDDPLVSPGAFEWNDGSDWDCDQQVASDQWTQQPVAFLLIADAETYTAYAAFAGVDADGSGRPELLVGAPDVSLGAYQDGAAYLFTDPELGRSIDAPDAVLRGGEGETAGSRVALLGGTTVSVAVFAAGHDGGLGGVYVAHEPTGEIALATDADATWRTNDMYLYNGLVLLAADADGDGEDELVLGTRDAIHLLPRDAVGVHALTDATGRLALEASRPGLIATASLDADGDGLRDVVVSAQSGSPDYYEGAVYLVLGPTLGTAVTLADADAVITDAGEDDQLGSALAAGDADGDGLDDVLVGGRHHATRGGGLLFTTPLDGAVEASTADATFLGGFGSGYGHEVQLLDFDGDGSDDSLVSGALFFATAGAYTLPDDASALIDNLQYGALESGARPVGDFDGDGRDDLLLGAASAWDPYTSQETYGIGLLMGIDRP